MRLCARLKVVQNYGSPWRATVVDGWLENTCLGAGLVASPTYREGK